VTRSVVGTAVKFFPVWLESHGAMISPIKADVPAPVRTIRRSLAQQRRQETVDRSTQVIDVVERADPAGRLLADLFSVQVPLWRR
jgi:hypothetical protein